MSSFMCALATLNDNNIPIYKAENGVYLVQDTIAAHLFDTVEWKDLARIIFTEQLEVLDPHYALIWRSLLHWHRIWKKHSDEVTTPFSKWAQVKVVRGRIGTIPRVPVTSSENLGSCYPGFGFASRVSPCPCPHLESCMVWEWARASFCRMLLLFPKFDCHEVLPYRFFHTILSGTLLPPDSGWLPGTCQGHQPFGPDSARLFSAHLVLMPLDPVAELSEPEPQIRCLFLPQALMRLSQDDGDDDHHIEPQRAGALPKFGTVKPHGPVVPFKPQFSPDPRPDIRIRLAPCLQQGLPSSSPCVLALSCFPGAREAQGGLEISKERQARYQALHNLILGHAQPQPHNRLCFVLNWLVP